MSDYPEGPGWWQASDQKWYPPESFPSDAPPQQPPPSSAPAPSYSPPPTGQEWGAPPGPGIPPAPGAAYPGAPGYPGMAPAGPKNNGLAVGSMVVSIISILCIQPIGVVGAIMGHVALGQIKKSEGTQGGRGMAIAGIVIGWIAFALFLLILALVLAGDGFDFTVE